MGFSPGISNISDLSDVLLNNPANNQALMYGTGPAKWQNQPTVSPVGGGLESVVTANTGASYSVNLANANMFVLTLTSSTTLSLTGATNLKACSITLMLKQDATGNRTVTWPASVKWPSGTAPTLTTSANKIDFISLLSVDGGTNWYGFVSGNNY